MLLIDSNGFKPIAVLSEGKGKGPMRIRGIFSEADTKNGNGRIYPKELLEREVKKLQPLIQERRLTGELDHPDSEIISLKNVSHVITNLYMEGGKVIGEAEVLPTAAGQTLSQLLEAGVRIGISSRGTGGLEYDMKQEAHVVQDSLNMKTWDIVADPSCQTAFPGLCESNGEVNIVETLTDKNRKERIFLECLRRNIKK